MRKKRKYREKSMARYRNVKMSELMTERSIMKRYIKILLTFCITLGLLSTTAFAAETDKPFDYEEKEIINTVQGILTEVDAFNDDELQYYAKNSLGITKTVCEDYLKLKENDTLGEFIEFEDAKVENTKNSAIVTVKAVYKKDVLTLTAIYKEIGTQIVPTEVKLAVGDAASAESLSKLDAVKNAGLNTLMGISIVVLMLLFISLIISLFKFIPKLQDKFTKRNENRTAQVTAVDNVVAQIAEKEELSDDTELAAVITAAICAATGSTGDSFVVRSIKRTRFR